MAQSKIIPFSKIKKIDLINVKGGITAEEIMKKYKPDVLVNLALYDSSTGTNITFLKDDGVKSGYYFSYDGIGIKGNKEIGWYNKDDAMDNPDVRDYISGSPVIIKDGKVVKEWGNKYSSYIDKSHTRTCIGFNDKNLILVTSDGAITLENMANHCLTNYSPTYMINCDGGGSSHLQDKEKIYTKSSRANVSWLLVYMNPEPRTVTVKDTVVHFKDEELNGIILDGVTQAPVRKICEKLGLSVSFIDGEVYIN